MLLWEFLRFVQALRPKYFLMENVRGLLSAAVLHRPLAERPERGGPPLENLEQPGSVMDLWLSDLDETTSKEYRVDYFEVNAVNYGAPQLRERVLFFGNRMSRVVDFPAPTHASSYANTQSGNRRHPEQTTLEVEEELSFRTLGDALATIAHDDGDILDFSPRKKRYLALVPEGGNWRALPEEIQRESMGRAWFAKGGRSGWWRRLTRDLPSPTVTTMPNHAATSMCHPTETRALTVRECAAIQEFPDEWEFSGTTLEKYTQVGNAIPVRLGEVAGTILAAHLDCGCTPSPNTEAVARHRRVYLRSHVRTRKWFKGGQAYIWKQGEDNTAAHYSTAPATGS